MRVPYTNVRIDYTDSRERRVLDLRTDGLAEVPVLGWYHYANTRHDLPMHRHTRTIEICLLGRGTRLFKLEDQQYHLKGGDVLVTMPDVAHTTAGLPSESCILYWLNLRLPGRKGSLLSLPDEEGTSLIQALLTLPRRHFPGNSLIKSLFDRLLELHGQMEIDLHRPQMRQAMLQLLLEVIGCSRRHALRESPRLMTDVIRFIQSQPSADVRLEDLARRVGLSLSRFKVRFKLETGMSPRQFILRTKIEAACERLADGHDSIGKIAFDMGFPTSQYFATVFHRFEGVTPKVYRRNAARSKGTVPCEADLQDQGA